METKKDEIKGFYATMRKDGRLTVPKGYREALGLKKGDKIQIIELRKIEPDMGILSISTTPVDGEVFVDEESWGIAPEPREVEVGLYDVTFGDVDLYTRPDAVVATVLVGETEVILGTYTLIPAEEVE